MTKKLSIISIPILLSLPAIMVSCSQENNNNDNNSNNIINHENFIYKPNNNSSKIVSQKNWNKMILTRNIAMDGNNRWVEYNNTNNQINRQGKDLERFAFIVDEDWIVISQIGYYQESNEKEKFLPLIYILNIYDTQTIKVKRIDDGQNLKSKEDLQHIIKNYKSLYGNLEGFNDIDIDAFLKNGGVNDLINLFSMNDYEMAKLYSENEEANGIKTKWYADRDDKIPVI